MQNTNIFLRTIQASLILSFLFFTVFSFNVAFGQGNEGIEIAKTYTLTESIEVQSGDIATFDPTTQQMTLSRTGSDPNAFGIVVFDPVLVLTTEDGGVPIVRGGEALVNVTAINGPILAGDFITTSTLPGKGAKALESDEYVIGVAIEGFAPQGVTLGGEVEQGQIQVLLAIGSRTEAVEELQGTIEDLPETGVSEATVLNIVQYLLAAFIAVGSIYIAFKNFAPSMRDGIASIGRNPLAKSSIQSMVLMNAIIIVLISAGGLLVSIAILLLPI